MVKKSRKRNSGVQDFPAKTFPLPEHGEGPDSMEDTPVCFTNSHDCSETLAQQWSYSKTCRVFSLPTTAEISESFSLRWTNSGMAWRGECLTADSSASPNHVEDSTLLDIVEARPKQLHYYLSPNAAQGILRRADAQGRNLFPPLRKALEILASDQLSKDLDTA